MIRDSETDVVVVWTTLPDDSDVESFGRTLVSEQLAACVVAGGPSQTVYKWRGNIEVATERSVTIKTTAERVGQLEQRIAELHPYDVPEFLVAPVQGGSQAYLDWVQTSLKPAQK